MHYYLIKVHPHCYINSVCMLVLSAAVSQRHNATEVSWRRPWWHSVSRLSYWSSVQSACTNH